MSGATHGPLLPSHFRCASCGRIFGKGWTDEEARVEASSNGIDASIADVYCDDCFAKTPWGASPTAGASVWSNTDASFQLTPESFAETIRQMLADVPIELKPRSVLVGHRAYHQAQAWRADPRYAQWDDATLALAAQNGLDPLTMKPEHFLWIWHGAQYC